MLLNTTQQCCQRFWGHFLVRKAFSTLLSLILIIGLLLPTARTTVSAAAPNAPTLLSPDNSVTTTAVDEGYVTVPPLGMPIFSWASVPGATMYQIRFSTDPNFATFAFFLTPLTQYTPYDISRFNDGIWYWQVRVESPTASDYSLTRNFTKAWASPKNVPTLISPTEGATVEFFDAPTFSWTPVVGAAFYRIQISIDPNFPLNNLAINTETWGTSYQPTDFLKNGLYYWHVIPMDAANHQGTISARGSFAMGYDEVPVLIEPLNASEPTFTPTFRWTAVRGAQRYELQYSTEKAFPSNNTTVIGTLNTAYTPTIALPNDKNYYWRVRAFNGQSYSSWSNQKSPDPWSFIKRWYIQPVLLTPIALYQYTRFPVFSWTPVPGAADYHVEVSHFPGFVPLDLDDWTENPFYTPRAYQSDAAIRYWRITPRDSAGNLGKTSIVGQFYSAGANASPDLISPLYYYPPNTFPAPDTAVQMQPHEDRSVAYPLFSWQRLFDFSSIADNRGNELARGYRLDVGTDMDSNGNVAGIVWSVKTENLSATPKDTEFTPTPGTIYYWQVTPLDGIGPSSAPLPMDQAQFSQVWKTRFDPAKGLPANAGKPQLLRPAYKQTYDPSNDPGYDSPEFVEITPALEWYPVQNATQYAVEINRSESFAQSTMVDTATVQQPVYAPRTSFGQRFLNHLNFGSYYWRVKALAGGTWTDWSNTWRFEIAAQSRWQGARAIGMNKLMIASDAASDVAADYDLTGLYAAQDQNAWYFGFDYSGAGSSTYVLYLDMDSRNNSGASVDKKGYPITANPAHRPEFAIYISKSSGAFAANNIVIYQWLGTTWETYGRSLAIVGGEVSAVGNYLELKIPYQAIGMQVETGTYSVALTSVDATNKVVDAVPDNPIASGSAVINNIATVSEHFTLALPGSDLSGDPTTYPSFPPFFWNYSTGAPWAGAWIRFYLDAGFSKMVGEYKITSNVPYYDPPTIDWQNDIGGDNTYYWRIAPRYLTGAESYGAWSQAGRFERKGFGPQNMKVSVNNATPTFSWERIEGANTYRLQVDTDPNYGAPVIDVTITENSFTPTFTLANGTFNWRVIVSRKNGEIAKESPSQTFTLSLPQPTGLTVGGAAIAGTPTFCWDVLSVSSSDKNPVLFPWRYQITVSRGDPNFSQTYDYAETTNNCYTPINKGYDDDTYYWKVAMYDGQNRLGAPSAVATFQKAYPIVKPKSPINGAQISDTPVFTWTAADGVTPYIHGAARYRLEVYLKPTFSDMYDSIETNQTSYIPTRLYDKDKVYYWRVAIVDRYGKVGPYTNAVITVGTGRKTFLPLVRK